MNVTYRLAGSLLALALLVTVTIGWGCDKHRRTYIDTYGTVGVALPAPPLPPASTMVAVPPPPPPPQYSQAAAQASIAAPALPRYEQSVAQPLPEPVAGQPADASGVEVLARGPVHEAFAEPVVANPAPGITVSVAPPAAVQELPPDERPAGAIWIPGYWGWDDDRSGFIWVSGIWRISPPGCRWVPGYWAPVADGYQWVPGFWLAETTRQVQYLPTPPQSLEAGPVGIAPSPDYIWSTGYWYRDSIQYAWRPGCWQMGRADWVWVPAHYVWTPRGCIFVAGYWDYGLGGRGLLFAPVRFGRPLYMQPGYFYSPSVVIQTDCLSFAFFSRPIYCHYYFGDYFDAMYVGLGIVPWYECRTRRDWYDPIYFHAAWSHRHEDRWEDREREHYDLLRRDFAARPPRTFALQAGFHVAAVQGAAGPAPRPVVMAAPLADVVARKAPGMRFEKIDAGRRTQLQQYASSLGAYRDQRVAVEAAAGAGRAAGRTADAGHALTAAAGASATGPAVAKPATVQKPGWTRPATDPRAADRVGPPSGSTKMGSLTPRTPDVQTPRTPEKAPAEARRLQPFVPAANGGTTGLATPRLPDVVNPKPPAAAPAEARKPDAATPSARSGQPRVVPWPVTPGGIRRPQPVSPPAASRPQPSAPAQPEARRVQPQATSPIPVEIKRPQPFVAAPEARRSQPAPQPQAPASRPQPQPVPVARPQPQPTAPRFQPPAQPVQPQRVERPAPPQAAPAPRMAAPAPAPRVESPRSAPPLERAAPPRIESPRMAPPASAAPPPSARQAQPAADGREKRN